MKVKPIISALQDANPSSKLAHKNTLAATQQVTRIQRMAAVAADTKLTA